ncbi:ScbA/BarX family gamma-butyrolactone biosynthesis protein [Streptomyces sp. NBC_01498]|uniref:ScbA/BarX family gamma-butyrolactone biosynthesis protein n=1 Tax=Streptomyces sp. NBC_01498 TaxID=2975870 RepID=UPI002E7C201F|nr:ScbA/BarX family gamma-butyrolactone biosynthesis protein [Streptomyces sp. NBC_01498]WTL24272.1 ScbA/BarX family gamma-butyrolactone biosynthesis protein [Streptomyces sp. NBC_01498]
MPRELVHRTSTAEVLLTDVCPDGRRNVFEAAASWPRSHPTFPRDGTDLHSPLIVVETMRQLGIYVPLRHYAVPPEFRSLITDLHFRIDPDAEPRALTNSTDVGCRVRVSDIRSTADGTVTGLRMEVAFRFGGTVFARAGGGARFVSPERYAALRGARTTARPPVPLGRPTSPDLGRLGVADARDVMLSVARGAVRLQPADPRHPFFFDHPSDHVPGMVMLEAARQAGALATDGRCLRPTAGRLKTVSFAEFAPAARVLCAAHHRTCGFRVLQGGRYVAYGALDYR